jgi:hypothetical protein
MMIFYSSPSTDATTLYEFWPAPSFVLFARFFQSVQHQSIRKQDEKAFVSCQLFKMDNKILKLTAGFE